MTVHERPKQRRKVSLLRWLAFVSLFALALISALLWRQFQQERTNYALMAAVHQGSTWEIGQLLRQGADPDTRETAPPPHTWREMIRHFLDPVSPSSADTVLMAAVKQGDVSVVEALLAAGAHVNAVSGSKQCALTLAVDGTGFDMMRVLLAHGANANVTTSDYSDRPIPVLIQSLRIFRPPDFHDSDCLPLVRSLVDHGADIDAADADGETPLLEAIEHGDTETALWIITQGAHLNQADHAGTTPLHVAADNADSPGIRRILTSLLQQGVDVTPARNGGWNLLCWAAEKGDLPLAREAIQRGTTVNSRDRHGRTPLMYAAANGTLPVLSQLLERGAEVNAQDDKGWTALTFAAQTNDVSIVEALLRHRADRRWKDPENRWTAEQRAMHVGQEEVAALLRSGRRGNGQKPERLHPQMGFPDDMAETRRRVRIDTHRWIEAVHLPDSASSLGDRACGVLVVDSQGKRGKPFGGSTFFNLPAAQAFRDTDGSLYAFVQGHHRAESNFVVAVRGRTLVMKAECNFEFGASCQPLSGGGVLVIGFERSHSRDDGSVLDGIPAAHQYDIVAYVARFRRGNLTDLGLIFLPQQR